MKKIIGNLLIGCVLLFGASEVDVKSNNIQQYNADPIEIWKDKFVEKYGPFGVTDKKGRTFFYGEAVVNVSPLDPAYVKELVIAYEKALLNMQADFILQTFGKESVKKLYETFEDDSTNADKFPPLKEAEDMAQKGKIAVIMDKFLDVVENSLDQKLIEQGVSPEKLKKMTVEQKKQLFKDNFSTSIAKEAFNSMSGLVPFSVKVATVDTGMGKATKVAVIAIQSPKTIQFAKDIARGRPTNVRGKPKSLRDILPKTKEDYLKEIGLRYTYDEQGRPMLISYGMWSVVLNTKNPTRYMKKIAIAKRKAKLRAESYIGDFIKTNIQAVESQDVESVNEEIAKKITTLGAGSEDVQKLKEDIKDTIDKYFKKIKATSNFRLKGTSEVYNWDYKDKNNLVYVGSVVTWSYGQFNNANRYIKMKNSQNIINKPKVQKVHQNHAAPEINRESKIINDVEDF